MKLRAKTAVIRLGASLFGLITVPLAHADGCSLKNLAGEWAFSEQGSSLIGTPGPFSNVGFFELEVKPGATAATGKGMSYATFNNQVLPPTALQSISAKFFDNQPCVGTATFNIALPPPVNMITRSITFSMFSNRKFQFVNTSGDQTTLGTAVKR